MALDIEPLLDRRIQKHLRELRKENAALRKDFSSLSRAVENLQAMQDVAQTIALKREAAPKPTGFSAERLRKHRAELGLSANDYATLAGVSTLSIYKWESGKSHPRRAQLELLSAIKDLDPKRAAELLRRLKPRTSK